MIGSQHAIQNLAKSPIILVFLVLLSACDQTSKNIPASNPPTTTLPAPANPTLPVVKEEEPSPEIKIRKFTRVFCEPGSNSDADHLYALRSDFNSTTAPLKIKFLDESGTVLGNIDSFKLLQSDGDVGFGILGQRIQTSNKFRIYSAEVDYSKKSGSLIAISTSAAVPADIEAALERLGHRTSYVGVSREFSYALLPDQGYYTLRDMRTFNILNRINISTEAYFNPTLSENGRWAFFTVREGNIIRQAQVSLTTGKVSLFPLQKETRVQFSPRWMNDGSTIVWLEENEKGKSVYSATQEEMDEGKANFIRDINNLPNSGMISFLNKGVLQVVWTDETFTSDIFGTRFVETGILKILSFDLAAKSTLPADLQSFSYPRELLNVNTPITGNNRLLNNIVYSPWTEQIFASLKPRRGLVSFDIVNKNWQLLATSSDAFSCNKPTVGPEFVLETSR